MKKSRFNMIFEEIMRETTKQEEQFNDLNNIVNSDKWYSKVELLESRKPIPLEILIKLAEDSDPLVRYKVARRKHLPLQILKKLINDKNLETALLDYHSTQLTPQMIQKLANSEQEDVRGQVATLLNLTPQIIQKLKNDPSNYVRKKIYENLAEREIK